jgi:colanic acid/amylovoran biosynthesis glycosyltransferase
MIVLRSLNVLRYGKDALSLSLLDRSIFIASQERFDVFHCHFGVNGEEAAILRQVGAFDAPIITTFHGYDIRDGIKKGPKIYRHLLKYGDEIHCISEYNREHLEKFGFSKHKIIFMPIGVDLTRFAKGAIVTQPDSRRVRMQLRVLTVARLSYEKGVDVALNAMAILRELRPEMDFFYSVIGDGPDRRDLEKLRDQLKLSGRVDLAGSADQTAVASELSKCDLFLLPSRAESLPVAIMEAMASGRAVVATQVGGVSELVVNGISGMLVRSEDPKAMAQSLSQLLGSADERARLGFAGRRLVQQRHNLAVLNDRLIERYARLCEL